MAFIKTIFSGISSAIKWLTQDDDRLREARARSLGQLGETDKMDKTGINKTEDNDRDMKDYIDPWEELDHFRTDMWFGRWGRRYTKRGVDKLRKRLKGEGEDETGQGKDRQG